MFLQLKKVTESTSVENLKIGIATDQILVILTDGFTNTSRESTEISKLNEEDSTWSATTLAAPSTHKVAESRFVEDPETEITTDKLLVILTDEFINTNKSPTHFSALDDEEGATWSATTLVTPSTDKVAELNTRNLRLPLTKYY